MDRDATIIRSNARPKLGVYVYGLAAAAFGVVTLFVPDYYDWLQLHWNAQDGRIFAVVASIAQVIGGATIVFRRTARTGSAILAAIYSIIAVLSVPQIIATPRVFSPWGDFFNQFALVVGAAMIFASASPFWQGRRLAVIGRILFGTCAVSFTLYQAFYLDTTARLVPKWFPPSQMFWAVATTVFLALASVSLLTNRMALLAARLLTLLLAIFGFLVWVPSLATDFTNHFKWTETVETFAIVGAAWIIADLAREEQRYGNLE